MANLITRQADFADYEGISALYKARLARLAKEQPDQYRPEGAEIGLAEQPFINTIDNPTWAFIVAEQDGQIVGAIQVSGEEEPETEYRFARMRGWIEELVVTEGDAVETIATTLIERAQSWAKEQKMQDLDFIVYDFNSELLKVTEKLGFTTASTRVRKSL